MNQNTEYDWAQLHFRAASGETLSEPEAAFYRAGLEQRENEEILFFDMAGLKKVRENILKLEMERTQLEKERLILQAKIAHLETKLSNSEKELLGVGG